MPNTYSLERIWRVYDDDDGSYIEIGPDADSLGLVVIRAVGSDGKKVTEILIAPEMVRLISRALRECVAAQSVEEVVPEEDPRGKDAP